MKIILLFTTVIVTAAAIMFTHPRDVKPAQDNNISNDNGFAVVELFTSEGCSSCPPADEVFEEISKQYKKNVYLLGYHVDYWNRLGWKDEFSSADYTARQQQYAQVFNRDGVYTPQAIVNGTVQMVGSEKTKLTEEIDKQLLSAVNETPLINSVTVNNRDILINCTVKENNNTAINIALVQLYALTDVKRGENEGRKLSHINIVRDLKTIDATGSEQSVKLTIPAGLTAEGCSLIVYTQHKETLKIIGAISKNLQ